MQTASSSTSSSCRWKYDVFLSFRGEDTRKTFIDHLYTAFNQKGLRVFRDDKKLERGKPISPELLHAIEESRSAVVVFSRNYASSTWCLDELVQIVYCKNINFFPVFYNVEPSVVRKQTEEFEEAFIKHEETFREDIGKVQTWRNALTEVANHSGFDLKDGYESQFIQKIVKEISSKLCFSKYASVENLVGIDSRLEELKKFISPESHDVRMIGICGMGGIGKTTIARVAYELFFDDYEGSSFLANVREVSEKGGLVSLQKMLLSEILDMKIDDINVYNDFDGIRLIRSRLGCKKVLIVIDDVNNPEQLEKLASNRDWFGMGSRIIITSRNKRLLTSHGVDGVYEAGKLNDDEALQLFISKAFKKHQPSESFRELSKHVVQYASGLPLALKVLGCFLCGREVHVWEDALQRLKRDCKKEILDILQISFDGLEESEKKIFLDMACFFKGMGRNYVTRILESCGFFPNIGIDILIDKSLIIILHDNTLWMHELLEQMGQQIVKRECPEEPGKRSRLWMEANIRHVLTENTGTEVVEGIILNFSKEEIHCRAKAFSKMINLRLLKICNVQLPEGLDYLSNNLHLLDWEGYPLKSLPPNMQLDKIIELKMGQSRIEQLQQGIKPFKFNNLASISFRECEYLIRTPDFTFSPNLKYVDLYRCKMLREIHPSLLVHKKITYLNMAFCTSLTTLPDQIHMESLDVLCLICCNKLEKFPEIVGSMDCLRSLNLNGTAIKVLPMSIELLSGLEDFDLTNCKNLVSLPVTINGLESLQTFKLSGCSKLENLPETLGQVEKLMTLEVRGTAIRRPIASIFLMKNLARLDFSGCKGTPSNSLSSLFLKTFRLPTLSGFCRSLQELNLSDCNMEEGAIPNDFFDRFSSLWQLELSKNNFVSLPGSIKHLSKLEDLHLDGCERLRSLPELPSNIKYINVNGCKRLQSLPQLPSNIRDINVNGCVALETTSNALRLCNILLSKFSCVNCLKLICCNNLASSMPREFLKAMSKPINEFSMVIPGSEIPEWFQHQSETSSIKIERPPDSYDNKMVGYAVCCVFDVHEMPTLSEGYYTHSIYCKVTNIFNPLEELNQLHFKENSGKAVSDHLWLFYILAERLNQLHFVELSFNQRLLQHSFNQGLLQHSFNQGFAEFLLTPAGGPRLEVKKCGIHPVYEKEIEELKPRAKKSSSSSFWNSYELDEDFLGSTADVDSDETEDEDDVDSDETEDEDVIYFSVDDEPVQPKRLKSS